MRINLKAFLERTPSPMESTRPKDKRLCGLTPQAEARRTNDFMKPKSVANKNNRPTDVASGALLGGGMSKNDKAALRNRMIVGAATAFAALDCEHWYIGIVVAIGGIGLFTISALDRWLGDEPPNDRADLPPTVARGPRSGTEGAIGG
jgi:hypothetical protein